MMVHVKILGNKKPQRYALQRAVLAAHRELLQEHPGLEVDITEVKDAQEIQKFTPVFVYPSLMVNEELVCIGRYPRKEEVAGWLRQAMNIE
jgi:predicted metal-dependent peptidase